MIIDLNKYLGEWYEIARIPFKFEQELTNVTAHYSQMKDGTIKVINSGYSFGKKVSVEGVAKLTDKNDIFKVSFVNGVESDYKILAVVDEPSIGKYSVALVGGESPDRLWILCRYPQIFESTYSICIDIAKRKGYNVDKLEMSK